MEDAIKIHDYVLDAPLTTNNSGFSRWGFGEKDGKKYFIKEFLSPVFPEDTSIFTEKQLKSKLKGCKIFVDDKTEIYDRLNRSSDGNAILVDEFFRYGSKYYVAMKKVHAIDVMPDSDFWDMYNRMICCRTLVHSVYCLHREGVVHADLKWTNILFSQSSARTNLVAKLIDFDNSFCIEKPPRNYATFNVDQVYCAPETFQFLNEEEVTLDDKIDVYALGILIHQIMCGCLPDFDSKYHYVYEAQLDDSDVTVSREIWPSMQLLIMDMLAKDPKERITSEEAMRRIQLEFKKISVEEDIEDDIEDVIDVGGIDNVIPESNEEMEMVDDFFGVAGDL